MGGRLDNQRTAGRQRRLRRFDRALGDKPADDAIIVRFRTVPIGAVVMSNWIAVAIVVDMLNDLFASMPGGMFMSMVVPHATERAGPDIAKRYGPGNSAAKRQRHTVTGNGEMQLDCMIIRTALRRGQCKLDENIVTTAQAGRQTRWARLQSRSRMPYDSANRLTRYAVGFDAVADGAGSPITRQWRHGRPIRSSPVTRKEIA